MWGLIFPHQRLIPSPELAEDEFPFRAGYACRALEVPHG